MSRRKTTGFAEPRRAKFAKAKAGRAAAGGMVAVPAAELAALHARIEDLEDARDLAAAAKHAKPADYLPAAMMNRIIDGEHPVRVWREQRGLSARALAAKAGMPVSYLSEIETGKKPGSIAAYRALADALDLAIDDLAR
jgi:ribosome-binding protein aMBF1 (putative translation factor)